MPQVRFGILQTALSALTALAGSVSMMMALVNERRMHRHRQPGVSYAQATMRRDGGWKNTSLFTEQGLVYQRRASRYGVPGAVLWVLALLFYILPG